MMSIIEEIRDYATRKTSILTYMAAQDAVELMESQAEKIAELEALLHDGRYGGSKDWVHSGLVGRVDWLIAMYEGKKNEADLWVDQLIEAGKKITQLKNAIRKYCDRCNMPPDHHLRIELERSPDFDPNENG